MVRLTLYGRPDCHLCHEMRAVVETVVRAAPPAWAVTLEEVDVDTDPALAAAHGMDVPVLCVNGVRAFAHRVEPAALRARLAREIA